MVLGSKARDHAKNARPLPIYPDKNYPEAPGFLPKHTIFGQQPPSPIPPALRLLLHNHKLHILKELREPQIAPNLHPSHILKADLAHHGMQLRDPLQQPHTRKLLIPLKPPPPHPSDPALQHTPSAPPRVQLIPLQMPARPQHPERITEHGPRIVVRDDEQQQPDMHDVVHALQLRRQRGEDVPCAQGDGVNVGCGEAVRDVEGPDGGAGGEIGDAEA
ncbi:hypothetical protein G7Y79_00034g069420 [Physcia stellaris]|nr:hypothetical protein G7Y79_00034g069420 [Physcia stellaris]